LGALNHVTTLLPGGPAAAARIGDFAVAEGAGGPVLIAAAQPGAGMFGYALAEGTGAAAAGTIAYPAGADVLGEARLTVIATGTGTLALPAGRFPAEVWGATVQPSGALGPGVTLPDGAGTAGEVRAFALAQAGGAEWLYGALPDGTLGTWRLDGAAAALIPQAGTGPAGGVSALHAAAIGGLSWLFTASAAGDSLSAWQVEADGTLTARGSLGAAEGLGIDAPAAVATVTVAGETYAVLGAAGTSSLTLLRPDPAGLVPTDHVSDSRDTRFQGVSALDTVESGDRAWIVAGGADDGISLFQVLPGGRLLLVDSIEDTTGLPLQNVAAVEAVAVGGEIQVFVASGSEDGIAQFRFDPGPAGLTLKAAPGGGTAAGGDGADILAGGAGADLLSGGGDGDILIDGPGADTLRGGAGADLFVLYADAAADRIEDFDPAEDRLDLSDWPLLHDVAQIAILPAAAGAVLTFGQETLTILSASGQPLSAADFTTDGVLNLPRSPSQLILDGRRPPPTPGDDVLTGNLFPDLLDGLGGNDSLAGWLGADTLAGGDGDDLLTGGPGADRLDGGAGTDTADYGDAAAGVTADLSGAGAGSGDALGDSFAGIENLAGSAHADSLTGDGAANLLRGEGGADTLRGGSGDDTLSGGAGADHLDGGSGFDTAGHAGAAAGVLADLLSPFRNTGWAAGDSYAGIEGLEGTDHGDDLHGDAGHNRLAGGGGVDWLSGRAGADTLTGGEGNDNLLGGPGADSLDGGAGFDRAVYTDATAGLLADLADPLLNAGAAAGDMFQSVEGLRGSNFDDDLRGDGAANVLDGGSGNDALSARGGADQLIGRAGSDALDGGDGNDVLFGGAGADSLVGGAGTDRANYSDSAAPVVADLREPARNTGFAQGDSYAGIENLQGSVAGDELGGDDLDNMINGGKGGDRIEGRGGADYLIGMEGADTLWGGAGADLLHGGPEADRFLFGAGDGADRVLDFAPGEDRLLLSAAIPGLAGLDGAAIVAAHATALATGVWFDFGGGDTLFVKGIADPYLLAVSIDVV